MNDNKQIKIFRDGCLVDFLNQEMKELQIAEMKKAIRAVLESRNDIMYIPYLAEPIAEKLVKNGYIKPFPNSVMFPREEYEEIKQYQSYIPELKKAFDKIRKETAERDFCTIIKALEGRKERVKAFYGIEESVGVDIAIRTVKKLAKQFGVEIKE